MYPQLLCSGPETVVACHSNSAEHGHGMAQKADDIFVCYCCSTAHDFLDGRTRLIEIDGEPVRHLEQNRYRRDAFQRAMARTWRLWADLGWINPG